MFRNFFHQVHNRCGFCFGNNHLGLLGDFIIQVTERIERAGVFFGFEKLERYAVFKKIENALFDDCMRRGWLVFFDESKRIFILGIAFGENRVIHGVGVQPIDKSVETLFL